LRIVGGTAGGRKLIGPPKGAGVRPTSDKVREAIFDVLSAALPRGIRGRVIDLFAGTGALGIEALSRGASFVLFIERDPAALRTLRENLRHAGFTDRAEVRAVEAGRAIAAMDPSRTAPFDLAFLDPPYGTGRAHALAERLRGRGLLGTGSIVVIETGQGDPQGAPEGFEVLRAKRYGDTRVLFLRLRERE
jgi:16S rRNA (guanine966-N2)-methyltransferase